MSLFNLGSFVHSDLPVTSGRADTSYHGEIHDPETGRLVKFHSPGQRKSYLARHPHIDPALLPPVQDPNRALSWDNASTVSGEPADLRLRAERRARSAALLADHAPTRHAPTKPKAAPTMTTARLCRHESSHAVACYILGRPIVRLSIIPTGDTAGHTWNHRTGEANKDDLVILAAGYCGEGLLMGDVNDHGSSDDVEQARTLALKLANGDVAKANALLREAEATARGIVEKHQSAILKLALRLQINKEFVLDLAENEIRSCIEAFEKKPAEELDDEWRRRIAMAQARQSVREYQAQQTANGVLTKAKGRVIREWNMANPTDAADFAKRMGLKPGSELVGHTDGYIARKKK